MTLVDVALTSSPIIEIDAVAQYSHPDYIGCLYCTEILLTARRQFSSSTAHSPDEYLVFYVCQFLFQPPFFRPNRTCIQHTMRFTTWSPLTNAFIISTVALLSLIQVANAFAELFIITPNGRELSPIPGDSITIRWYVPNRAGSQDRDWSLMTGISGSSTTILNYLQPIPRA